MKATLLSSIGAVIVLLTSAYVVHAPLATYVTINDGTARCQFSFPDNYQQRSETEATMYSASADDVTYEMHHRNTTNIASLPGQNFQAQINNTSQAAKLQQFTDRLAQATGGRIINQFAVTQNGQQGREVEIDFEEEGDTWRMHTRFFWHNNTMYAFTISAITYTGSASAPPNSPSANAVSTTTLASAKNQVFGSISFY